jgi:hypothetical protein
MTVASPPAPIQKPARNRLGIAALVVVLVAIVAPIVVGIVGVVDAANAPMQNASSGGWAVLGGFAIALIGVCLIAPLAIIGVVLAIISLTRKDRGKVAGVVAIVLGILPSLAVFGIPYALSFLN